jgi:2-dehydropantoate 2-reductase
VLSRALIGAGLRAPVRSHIRSEIWTKLWGNVAFNPLSILTRATLEQMCADPAVRTFARSVMVEVEAVANALGERMAVSVEQRIDGTAAVGAHKPSTLQDLESGRPMELDALIHAVVELARVANVETPNLNALDGMAGLLDRTSGAG